MQFRSEFIVFKSHMYQIKIILCQDYVKLFGKKIDNPLSFM